VATGVQGVSKLTARQQTIMELLQTESNYVSVIDTILKVSPHSCCLALQLLPDCGRTPMKLVLEIYVLHMLYVVVNAEMLSFA